MNISKLFNSWKANGLHRLLLLFVISWFLWVIILPDGSPGSVNFTAARNIIRHGCAAVIDDSRLKLRHFPQYILGSRLQRYVTKVGLKSGYALGLLALSLQITRGFRKQARLTAALGGRGLFGQWALSYQRPPPLGAC